MEGAQYRTKKLPEDVNNYLKTKVEEYVIETCGNKLNSKIDLILGRLIINLGDLLKSNVSKMSQRVYSQKPNITVELLEKISDEKLKFWIKLSSENKPLPPDPSFKSNENIKKEKSL